MNSSQLGTQLAAVGDLKEQLKKHLNARLVYFDESGLDMSALFFGQSLPVLQSKLPSFSLLDLYVLKARTEEVDKMFTQGLLSKHEQQRIALQQEQARLGAVSQRFRECAVRYSQGSGLTLNLAASAFPAPPTTLPTAIATTTASPSSSSSSSSSTTMTTSASGGMSGSSSGKSASDRPYNPFDPDGSSDMSLCSPVRDPYQSHHHRPQQHPPHHHHHRHEPNNDNRQPSHHHREEQNNANRSQQHQPIHHHRLEPNNEKNAHSQLAPVPSVDSQAKGGTVSAVSDGPSPKRQKRMRDAVQGLIEENERIFTEFALLYLEQEKTYSTLLERYQRAESDLATSRGELEKANGLIALLASTSEVKMTPIDAPTTASIPMTNSTTTTSSISNSNLLVDVAKSALAIAFGADEAATSSREPEKATANNNHSNSTASTTSVLREQIDANSTIFSSNSSVSSRLNMASYVASHSTGSNSNSTSAMTIISSPEQQCVAESDEMEVELKL